MSGGRTALFLVLLDLVYFKRFWRNSAPPSRASHTAPGPWSPASVLAGPGRAAVIEELQAECMRGREPGCEAAQFRIKPEDPEVKLGPTA